MNPVVSWSYDCQFRGGQILRSNDPSQGYKNKNSNAFSKLNFVNKCDNKEVHILTIK